MANIVGNIFKQGVHCIELRCIAPTHQVMQVVLIKQYRPRLFLQPTGWPGISHFSGLLVSMEDRYAKIAGPQGPHIYIGGRVEAGGEGEGGGDFWRQMARGLLRVLALIRGCGQWCT